MYTPLTHLQVELLYERQRNQGSETTYPTLPGWFPPPVDDAGRLIPAGRPVAPIYCPENNVTLNDATADVVLRCGRWEWGIHSDVVYNKVGFFKAVLDTNWRDRSKRGLITIPEDDPFIVTLLLEAAYTGTYAKEKDVDLWVPLNLYLLAEKVRVPKLQTLTATRLFVLAMEGPTWVNDDSFVYVLDKAFRETDDLDTDMRRVLGRLITPQRRNEAVMERLAPVIQAHPTIWVWVVDAMAHETRETSSSLDGVQGSVE